MTKGNWLSPLDRKDYIKRFLGIRYARYCLPYQRMYHVQRRFKVTRFASLLHGIDRRSWNSGVVWIIHRCRQKWVRMWCQKQYLLAKVSALIAFLFSRDSTFWLMALVYPSANKILPLFSSPLGKHIFDDTLDIKEEIGGEVRRLCNGVGMGRQRRRNRGVRSFIFSHSGK